MTGRSASSTRWSAWAERWVVVEGGGGPLVTHLQLLCALCRLEWGGGTPFTLSPSNKLPLTSWHRPFAAVGVRLP